MLGSASEAAAMCARRAEAEERSVRSSWGFFSGGGAFKVDVGLGFREGCEEALLLPKVLISSTDASFFALVCSALPSSSSSSNTGRLAGAGAAFLRFSPYLSDIFCKVDMVSVK